MPLRHNQRVWKSYIYNNIRLQKYKLCIITRTIIHFLLQRFCGLIVLKKEIKVFVELFLWIFLICFSSTIQTAVAEIGRDNKI